MIRRVWSRIWSTLDARIRRQAAPAPILAPTSASQWELIWRRFKRHRLAVAALLVMIVMYLTAALAEFVSPYPQQWRDMSHAYCPPQPPRFSLDHGLHVYAVRQVIDPVTLKKSYVEDADTIVPLGLFAEGEPYRLWGFIPCQRHLLGVDREKYEARAGTKGTGSKAPVPTFYLLGADRYGQDLFSRVVYGSRISLSVGLVAIFVTFVLGLAIGGLSGYIGGAFDTVIQRVIEILNALPRLPLWLALGAVVPADWPSLWVYVSITIVLSLLAWTDLARVVRGKMLALREEDYAVAARLLGAGHGRIIFRHLLPAFTSHIIVVLTLQVPAMILGETSLSFLGLGLRPPVVSWGVLLQDCMNMQVVANYPWLLLPVLFIILAVLAFNFVGDALRDAADPYA